MKPPDSERGSDAAQDAPTGPLGGPRVLQSAAALAGGELVAGRFRIQRLLGRGGMGEVYAAEDLELRQRIALKIVPPALASDERALERFRREVNLARRVTHPNVCRLFDVFHHSPDRGPSVAVVTMELLLGETLKQRLQRVGRLDLKEARSLVDQMLEAVAAAHAAGVIHQDLKSANVMLVENRDGPTRVVITDFGLARGQGREGDEGPGPGSDEVLGTLAYMAPEQLAARAVTPATDVFALGVVLYEMLTGRLPFPVAASGSPFSRSPPVSPATLVPGLDSGWDAAITRCLQARPAERFPRVEALQAALGLDSGRPSAPGRTGWRIGQWLVSGAAVAVALTLGLWAGRETTPPAPAAPVHAEQLTTSSGLDVFPAVAPDGARIAYSSHDGGGFGLRVLSLAPGARPAVLTTDAGDDVEPAWSPDGLWVAFHSLRKRGIWVIPSNGGEARQVADFGSRPVWSPDGQRLAFQSDALSPLDANAVPARSPSTIWTVALDVARPLQVTSPGEPPGGHGTPSWSPDGTRIAFGAYERARSSLWSVPAAGGEPRKIPHDAGYLFDPVWGRGHVVFTARSPRGSFGLHRISVDEAGRAQGPAASIVAVGLGTPRHLAISPDGQRLYYSALSLSSNLWWLPLDAAASAAGEPRPLTSETGRNSRPAFSRDGSLLAFEKWSAGDTPDIWLMDRDGGHARALSLHAARDDTPSFSPEGRVVFLSLRDGGRALWTLDPASGETTELCPLPPAAEFPRLSRDGRSVVFNASAGAGATNLWLMPICGEPAALTRDDQLVGFAAWSPDGRVLAAQQRRGETDRVVIVSVADGSVRPLTHDEQDWAYSFSPDGRRVAFSRLRDGAWNLWWVSRDTEPVERQLTFRSTPHGYVRYPAWSPTGEGLVYEVAESRGNVWALDLP